MILVQKQVCIQHTMKLHVDSHTQDIIRTYGVATISRLLKIIGLFGRISSLLQGCFAKETWNFKEPTNRSHPISSACIIRMLWDMG